MNRARGVGITIIQSSRSPQQLRAPLVDGRTSLGFEDGEAMEVDEDRSGYTYSDDG